MPSPKTSPARANESYGVRVHDPHNPLAQILITSISKAGVYYIDGVEFEVTGPVEFYSPISCTEFSESNYELYHNSVVFVSEGPVYPYALKLRYNNFAITSEKYDFGLECSTETPSPEDVEAQLIADYATAGIGISRLATSQDFIDDPAIISAFNPAGGMPDGAPNDYYTNIYANFKIDPTFHGGYDETIIDNSDNAYYWREGDLCVPGEEMSRGFFLTSTSASIWGDRHYYNIAATPAAELWRQDWLSLTVFIKSYQGARSCIVKLD